MMSQNGRILCLDIGQVRIGIAVSDPLCMIAQGIGIIKAGGLWLNELDGFVARYSPAVILLGYPVRTDGSIGPEAQHILEVSEVLKERYPSVSIRLWDERYTTTIATRTLIEGGMRRDKRRSRVDAMAAAIILQDYIEYLGRKK